MAWHCSSRNCLGDSQLWNKHTLTVQVNASLTFFVVVFICQACNWEGCENNNSNNSKEQQKKVNKYIIDNCLRMLYKLQSVTIDSLIPSSCSSYSISNFLILVFFFHFSSFCCLQAQSLRLDEYGHSDISMAFAFIRMDTHILYKFERKLKSFWNNLTPFERHAIVCAFQKYLRGMMKLFGTVNSQSRSLLHPNSLSFFCSRPIFGLFCRLRRYYLTFLFLCTQMTCHDSDLFAIKHHLVPKASERQKSDRTNEQSHTHSFI